MRRKHLILLIVLLSGLLAATTFGLHGFSIAVLKEYIDASPPDVLWGKARGVRADDWLAYLPNVLAQLQHRPPFPVINQNIGGGTNMLIYPNMPVAHPLGLFRPSTFGYWFGIDQGLGWQWFTKSAGLFYSSFWLFTLLLGPRFWLALSLALAYLLSPFVQFWALNNAEILTYTNLIIIGVWCILSTAKMWHLVAASLLACYAAACFGLFLYPPYQIACAYLAIGLGLTLLCLRWSEITLQQHAILRVLGLLAVPVFAFGILAWFIRETETPFSAVLATSYPGKRLASGGDMNLAFFFSNWFLWFKSSATRNFGNICEGASFFFVFPLSLILLGSSKRETLWHTLPLISTMGILGIWMVLGLPPAVAKLLGLSLVPSKRALIAFGLANLFLLGLWSSTSKTTEGRSPRSDQLALTLWLVAVACIGYFVHHRYGVYTKHILQGWLAAATLGGVMIYRRKWSPVLFLTIMVWYTPWFNPFDRGFAHYLKTNPISQKMLEIGSTNRSAFKERSRWAVFGDPAWAQLPKMLGLAQIGGEQFYPHSYWHILDPIGRSHEVYNRYGFVSFAFPPEGIPSQQIVFSNPAPNEVRVALAATHTSLEELGIRYLLVAPQYWNHIAKIGSAFRILFQYRRITIMERVRDGTTEE